MRERNKSAVYERRVDPFPSFQSSPNLNPVLSCFPPPDCVSFRFSEASTMELVEYGLYVAPTPNLVTVFILSRMSAETRNYGNYRPRSPLRFSLHLSNVARFLFVVIWQGFGQPAGDGFPG